jgi:hypothetical protein
VSRGVGTLRTRQRFELDPERRTPGALPLDRRQQRSTGEKAERHRRDKDPQRMAGESEQSGSDGRGQYEEERAVKRAPVNASLKRDEVLFRNEEAERRAGEKRGRGDRGDGAHARASCKARGERSSRENTKIETTKTSEP